MRLYHGSFCKIDNIDLSQCRDYKDFGRGFYLTDDYARAVTMANRSVDLNGKGQPEINSYIFNKSKFQNILKIKEFKSENWEWAKFVMDNRDKSSKPPYSHEYDVVVGPVADSRVDPILKDYRTEFGNDYLEPSNLAILAQRLKYPGKPYIQYCFCSEVALSHLILDN